MYFLKYPQIQISILHVKHILHVNNIFLNGFLIYRIFLVMQIRCNGEDIALCTICVELYKGQFIISWHLCACYNILRICFCSCSIHGDSMHKSKWDYLIMSPAAVMCKYFHIKIN